MWSNLQTYMSYVYMHCIQVNRKSLVLLSLILSKWLMYCIAFHTIVLGVCLEDIEKKKKRLKKGNTYRQAKKTQRKLKNKMNSGSESLSCVLDICITITFWKRTCTINDVLKLVYGVKSGSWFHYNAFIMFTSVLAPRPLYFSIAVHVCSTHVHITLTY